MAMCYYCGDENGGPYGNCFYCGKTLCFACVDTCLECKRTVCAECLSENSQCFECNNKEGDNSDREDT